MQISKRRLKNKDWQVLYESLVMAISGVKNSKDVLLMIDVLSSQTEKIMMAKRLMIVVLTVHGWSVSEIVDFLKVSKSTVYKQQVWLRTKPKTVRLVKSLFAKPKRSGQQKEPFKTLNRFFESRNKRSLLFGMIED